MAPPGTRSEPQCAQPARTSTRVFRSQTSLCRLASTLASESALCEPLHGRVYKLRAHKRARSRTLIHVRSRLYGAHLHVPTRLRDRISQQLSSCILACAARFTAIPHGLELPSARALDAPSDRTARVRAPGVLMPHAWGLLPLPAPLRRQLQVRLACHAACSAAVRHEVSRHCLLLSCTHVALTVLLSFICQVLQGREGARHQREIQEWPFPRVSLSGEISGAGDRDHTVSGGPILLQSERSRPS